MNTAPSPKRRVLIVDRNDDLCELFSVFLESDGFDVRTTRTGLVAMTYAADFAPHVVFASLRIGELDGFMLARELRKLPATANSFLVAMSAFSHESCRVRATGFNHYVTKPLRFESLIALLQPVQSKEHASSPIP